ncbi:MAG: ABC transporter substrate-binding protein, partial [Bacillota bacterium]
MTVTMELEGMDPDFLAKMLTTWILEPGSCETGDFAGTGPFMIAEFAEDERLTLNRFDDYWGGKPKLDQVVFRGIPDPDTQILELETGGIDIALFAPPKEGQRLEGLGFNVMEFGRVNWARVVFNMTTVTDLDVRRAICYAIDRQALIDVAYAGYGVVMDQLAVPGSWAHDESAPSYYYDPDEAKAVLDEAGYVDTDEDGIREINGEPINLHLPVRGDD